MIDYDKYLYSKTVHYISNSGSDERGQYHGGQAGDQTGKEWQLRPWYNRPWTCVLRYPDIKVGLKIAELAIAAALNPNIGYDQYQRNTYWRQLEKVGYDPSKIDAEHKAEEDCTSGVTANVKAVGHLMGIKALADIELDTFSRNMRQRFVAAGFRALTASKYLTGTAYLLPGDILLYENHHAATNITYGAAVRGTTPEPDDGILRKGDKGEAVKAMQKKLLAWNPDCLPRYGADGDFGAETQTALKAFQTVSKLEATGTYDAATKRALEAVHSRVVVITGDTVNVRSSASKANASNIIGGAKKGDTFKFLFNAETLDGLWYAIDYKGQIAYVSSKYAEVDE